jgi:hypothetical protein
MPRDYRNAPPPPLTPAEYQHPDSQPCPGRCNAGYRAAERTQAEDGKPHEVAPRYGQPVWCPPCATAIRGALQDLPELAVRLSMEINSGIGAAASEAQGIVAGTRERAVHEHQAATFALDELAEWVAEWEDKIRKARALPDREPHINPLHTVLRSSIFLRRHLAWVLAEHPEHDARLGIGKTLLTLYRRLQLMTKTQPVEPERCLGVRCPECDKLSLEYQLDKHGVPTGYIRCRVCRPEFTMPAAEYKAQTVKQALTARDRGKVSPAMIAEVFGNDVPPFLREVA